MTTKDTLSLALSRAIQLGGTPIMVRYFSQSYDDIYDDSVILTRSGADVWTSGLIFPLNGKSSSSDSLLVEAGKLASSDKKLYVVGSLIFTGSELQVKVQIGSPGDVYNLITDGTVVYEVENTPIYKKVYLRRLTGSLLGE